MEETRWKEKNQYLGLTEDGRRVRLLDQSQLPNREVWLELEEPEELAEAIRTLRVRGAPAIGVFAAYALYVLARRLADRAPVEAAFRTRLREWAAGLAATRPTAVNLRWALERMLAKKTELPVLTVNTDGMELYDRGEEKAYLALFEKFSDKNEESEDMNDKDRPRIGIIGMTPQDVSDLKAADKTRKVYADQGMRAICYGMGDGLDEVRNASLAAKNVVVSPAALKAAQYLQKKFGTPYEIAYPLVSELVPEVNYQGKKILIVQQQVIANAVRKEIEKRTGEKEAITTATWFMRKEEILMDLNVDAVDDISLKEEDDFISLVEKEGYDVIFADPCMERMIPGFEGVFIPLTHFAVSGKLNV